MNLTFQMARKADPSVTDAQSLLVDSEVTGSIVIDPADGTRPYEVTHLGVAGSTKVFAKGRAGYMRSNGAGNYVTIGSTNIDLPAAGWTMGILVRLPVHTEHSGNNTACELITATAANKFTVDVRGDTDVTSPLRVRVSYEKVGGGAVVLGGYFSSQFPSPFGTSASASIMNQWVWLFVRRSAGAALAAENYITNNEYQQPANTIMTLWSPALDDPDPSGSSIAADPSRNITADGAGANGVSSITGLSLRLGGTASKTSDIARFFKCDSILTANQLGLIAGGARLAEAGVTTGNTDCWVELRSAVDMADAHNADQGGAVTGSPTFAVADGPLQELLVGTATTTARLNAVARSGAVRSIT